MCSALAVLAPLSVEAAEPAPFRVYYIGNSLTDTLNYDVFKKMVERTGQPLVWGRKMVPGAPLYFHWDKPKEGFMGFGGPPVDAFVKHDWDAVTLQTFLQNGDNIDKAVPAAVNFVKLLRERSPNALAYIYAQWPTRGEDWMARFDGPNEIPGWAGERKTWPVLMEKLKAAGYGGFESRSMDNQYKAITAAVRLELGDHENIRLIPAGQAMRLLAEKMAAGQVPGSPKLWQQVPDARGKLGWVATSVEKLTSLDQLYADGIHLNNVGAYLVACSFYATLFKKSPADLDSSFYSAPPSSSARPERTRVSTIPQELADVIEQTVWETVATEPFSGVVTDGPLKVVTPALPNGFAGRTYSTKLRHAFGRGPWTWSADKLPEGLAIDEKGVLKGRLGNAGEHAVTVQVTDSTGAKAKREFALRIVPSSQPEITVAAPSAIRRGDYVYLPLTSKGGNGPVRWSADRATLPPGMSVQGGALVGSPGAEGDFLVKLTVTDSDPDKRQSTSGTLALKVTPAAPETLLLSAAGEIPPVIDGTISGNEWAAAKGQPVSKPVVGKGAAEGSMFTALWAPDALYVAVKVASEPKPGSRVTLYLDPTNSRENEYNSPHLRLRILPDGKIGEGSVGGNAKRYTVKTSSTTGGWIVECAIPWDALVGKMKGSANTVIGLDVAVEATGADGKPTVSVWRGSAENESVPAAFGTAILQ